MILSCYIDEDTYARLLHAASDLGKTIEELAEASISEAALNDAKARHRNGERSLELRLGE